MQLNNRYYVIGMSRCVMLMHRSFVQFTHISLYNLTGYLLNILLYELHTNDKSGPMSWWLIYHIMNGEWRLRKCNQLAMHKNRRWIVQAWRIMALHWLHIEPLIISCLPILLILIYQYVTLCSMVFCSFSASHDSIMPLIPSELLTFVLGIHWSVVKAQRASNPAMFPWC